MKKCIVELGRKCRCDLQAPTKEIDMHLEKVHILKKQNSADRILGTVSKTVPSLASNSLFV